MNLEYISSRSDKSSILLAKTSEIITLENKVYLAFHQNSILVGAISSHNEYEK